MADPEFIDGLRPIPTGSPGGPQPWLAADLMGIRPTGEPVAIELSSYDTLLLLAFLTTNCEGCDEYWLGFRDAAAQRLPDWVSTVIVTKGEPSVSQREVAAVAAGVEQVPVVMSDQAWSDYRVSGYPLFVLVDPSSRSVVGETVGFGWSDVTALIQAAGARHPADDSGDSGESGSRAR